MIHAPGCRAGMCAAADPRRKQPQPSHVLQALLWNLAAPACNMSSVRKALMAAHDSAFVEFPKFRRLVEILEKMVKSKATFHGIVFVRRRQGVHAVVQHVEQASTPS